MVCREGSELSLRIKVAAPGGNTIGSMPKNFSELYFFHCDILFGTALNIASGLPALAKRRRCWWYGESSVLLLSVVVVILLVMTAWKATHVWQRAFSLRMFRGWWLWLECSVCWR
jgi:hypothetical protein